MRTAGKGKGAAIDESDLFRLWTLLRQTYLILAKNQDRALQKHGINMPQYMILFLVRHSTREVTPSLVASWLAQELPTVMYGVDRLVRKGWLTKARSTADGRETILALTDEGKQLVDVATPTTWEPLMLISEALTSNTNLQTTLRTLKLLRDRGAILYGANIEALDFGTRHLKQDPTMWGDVSDAAETKAPSEGAGQPGS